MSSTEYDTDVLVIGAGPAGSAVVTRLAEHGARVTCLEQGDWVPLDARPKAFDDFDVRARRTWAPNPTRRKGPHDYDITSHGDDPVEVYQYNAVGGSAIGYGGHFWRLLPSDFRTKTLDGYADDWPISYRELAGYYDLNEQIMGVSGIEGDPTGPERGPYPTPPLPIGALGRAWIKGFEKLGWYWWPQDNAIVSRDYAGRHACIGRGFCTLGCPSGSLSTPDIAYWPRALKAGANLVTQARVREITVDDAGRATGALYYDADGAIHHIRARVVVVCANGVGTPRLLLSSVSAAFPDGLANSSGLVGRNFMVHVQSVVTGRFPEPLDVYQGHRGSVISSRHFYETDPGNDFVRGFMLTGMRGNSPLNTALGGAPWGRGHHAALEASLNHDASVWICGDDEPDLDNRIELDWSRLDAYGLPGARTVYRLTDNSRKIGEAGIARAREFVEAAGATDVRDVGLSPILGWHLLGTARMGTDPANSVVDADHRAHDVPNLYVVDGSSFVTSASVNPTNTIQALALRAADRIWEGRRWV